MTQTGAERQATYRQRRATAGDNGERRISTWVATGAALALERHHGVSQREMLEQLITAADGRITKRLDPTSPEWTAYFSVTE